MARAVPDWPHMMRRSTAALYCDMTTAEFEREMAAGNVPLPVSLATGERWSRRSLDEHLERLTGANLPDWRQGSNHYAAR